jgi:hypothetical protein
MKQLNTGFYKCHNKHGSTLYEEVGQDSGWLRDGRLRGRSSNLGRVKNVPFSVSFTPSVNLLNHNPNRWVQGVKKPGREADQSPPSNADVTPP